MPDQDLNLNIRTTAELAAAKEARGEMENLSASATEVGEKSKTASQRLIEGLGEGIAETRHAVSETQALIESYDFLDAKLVKLKATRASLKGQPGFEKEAQANAKEISATYDKMEAAEKRLLKLQQEELAAQEKLVASIRARNAAQAGGGGMNGAVGRGPADENTTTSGIVQGFFGRRAGAAVRGGMDSSAAMLGMGLVIATTIRSVTGAMTELIDEVSQLSPEAAKSAKDTKDALEWLDHPIKKIIDHFTGISTAMDGIKAATEREKAMFSLYAASVEADNHGIVESMQTVLDKMREQNLELEKQQRISIANREAERARAVQAGTMTPDAAAAAKLADKELGTADTAKRLIQETLAKYDAAAAAWLAAEKVALEYARNPATPADTLKGALDAVSKAWTAVSTSAADLKKLGYEYPAKAAELKAALEVEAAKSEGKIRDSIIGEYQKVETAAQKTAQDAGADVSRSFADGLAKLSGLIAAKSVDPQAYQAAFSLLENSREGRGSGVADLIAAASKQVVADTTAIKAAETTLATQQAAIEKDLSLANIGNRLDTVKELSGKTVDDIKSLTAAVATAGESISAAKQVAIEDIGKMTADGKITADEQGRAKADVEALLTGFRGTSFAMIDLAQRCLEGLEGTEEALKRLRRDIDSANARIIDLGNRQ